MSSAPVASASAKKGKKRRRTLLTPCSGRNGVDDAVGGTAESCDAGFGRTRDWSGLPEPAVHLILTALLPSYADAFSLGSVCKAWRSVFAVCKRELFLSLPPLLVDHGSSHRSLGGFYSLGERRFYHRKHPYFWPGMLFYRTNVMGVSHGYWIIRSVPLRVKEPSWVPLRVKESSPVFLMDPLSPEVHIRLPQAPHDVWSAVMAAPPASPDCVVVLLKKERILYCRPGDTQWVEAPIDLNPHLVAILGGKLYTLHTNGKIGMVELLPRPTVTFLETEPLPKKKGNFLMESNGEILHFAFLSSREHEVIVRRLDIHAREWVTLSTLGDRCLFLNWRWQTCLTRVAPARWGGERDCIYTFCPSSGELLVLHMKADRRAERHQILKKDGDYDWLTPSFCYP